MRNNRARMMWLVLGLVSLAGTVAAQEPARQIPPSFVPTQLPEYQVGPGDLLSLHVFGLTDLDQTIRVSNSGRVHVRHLGLISVSGMTVAQIEDEIGRRLREQQLLTEPWVRVQITEFYSQPVFVVGEVTQPGQFMITGETYLLDVISKAGGFTSAAGLEGYLLRRAPQPAVAAGVGPVEPPGPPPVADSAGKKPAPPVSPDRPAGGEPTKINIRDLKEGRNPDLNVRLIGGDVFYVPRRVQQRIFIVGDVPFPGAYGLPQSYDHITAGRAVSYAGGPLKTAKNSSAFILRYDEKGQPKPIAFDFMDVTMGKKPDIPIRPEDIIFVPRSVRKTIGYQLLLLVPHMTQQFLIF